MPLYPFTPQGVQQKANALYALPDPQLLAEAQAAGNNFASWLTTSFSMSQNQVAYLSSVPPNVIASWGHLVATAIIGRRPIVMGSLPTEPGRTKETSFTSIIPLGTEYNPGQNGQAPVINYIGDLKINFKPL